MSAIHDYGLFVIAAAVLIVTPGPDTAYIVGRSVAQGRLAGIVSALGIQLGLCVHVTLAALGLTALVAASQTAFTVVKIAGAIYLVWIGLGMLRTRAHADAAPSPDAVRDHRPARTLLLQAFLSNVLNPKVIVFFLSFFPQFVNADDASTRVAAFLALGATMLVLNTAWQLPLAWVAASLTHRVRQTPRMRVWLERMAGVAFIAIGLKLALTRRA